MAPVYKLTYFAIKALGEPIRFLFAYGGIPFEDHRIQLSDWEKYKSSMLYGKLPILEVDGKIINQSAAICRYLAKTVKLTGSDEWEALQIDAIVDTIADLRSECASYFFEKDEAAKAKKKDMLLNVTAPLYLSKLNKTVEENNGHFVGGKLTWADLFFAALHETLNCFLGYDIMEKHPGLKALVTMVYGIPAIKSWISKRPATDL